jgi:hypothetical protein
MYKKSELSTSFVLVLLLFSSFILPVIANGELSTIHFNAFVSGNCFVGLTGMTLEPPYIPNILFTGSGKGIGGISGSVEAVSHDTPYLPGGPPFELLGPVIYSAESLSTQGYASVSWKDEDNVKHRLFVSLDLTEGSESHLFEPNNDVFWIPMPGPGMQPLTFNAIHMSRSHVELISGMALFAVMPFPFGPGTIVLNDPAVVLFLFWMDEGTGIQYQYSIFWSSETKEITNLMPFLPFNITAASVFNSNVEVDD